MNDDKILIPIPELFSFEECRWFLDRNYDDCLHVVTVTGVRKALKIAGGNVLFEIAQFNDSLAIQILVGEPEPYVCDLIRSFVVEWLDLGRDIKPFYELLSLDSRVAYMTDDFRGLRLVGINDVFEALCWSIIGQQINLSFAYRLKRRMVEQYGSFVCFEGIKYHIFPSPEVLDNAEVNLLRTMQFSQKKAEYIIGVAKAFSTGALSMNILKELPDVVTRQRTLMNLKGVGVWTANYALMKALREPTTVPYGDVGLLHALSAHGVIENRNEIGKIDQFFSQVSGWETYMTTYLWRSLATRYL
jgi:DNA-3-methyladenine glycosylase II